MADQTLSGAVALAIDKAVVVIGAGPMGSGIAEVAASAGHRVYLRDTSEAALDKGMSQIRGSLGKRIDVERLPHLFQRGNEFAMANPIANS